MWRFESPQYLTLLWIVPIILILSLWLYQRNVKALAAVIGSRLSPFLLANVSTRKKRIKLVLEAMTLGLFILAMARPQLGQSQQKIKSEGVEIVLAVDVSNSMLAEDVKPSRMEQVKTELGRFLDLLGGDKVGLVAFAGSSITLSPLTPDKSALKMFIESLNPDAVMTQGTNFSSALRAAQELFKNGGVDVEDDVSASRVVLVFSDGEDQEKGAVDQAQALANDGIRIFGIAVGTEAGGPIPVRDERGNLIGYKKDRNGQMVLSQSSGESLSAIARAGAGKFYHLTFGGDQIKQLRQDLEKLEKAEFESDLMTNYDEKFQYILLLGILLGCIELLLGERKNSSSKWLGRFEVSK